MLLISLVEKLKRIRELGYNFNTLVPGFLINLYDTNVNDDRSYHHLLEYEGEEELFNYPILITQVIYKAFNDYYKNAETARKEQKVKPKGTSINYVILKNTATHINIGLYVEGFNFNNDSLKIPKILKDSTYYKTQMEIIKRSMVLYSDKRKHSIFSVGNDIYQALKDLNDIHYEELEHNERIIKYPLASSLFFSLRKAPDNIIISITDTNNEDVVLTAFRYTTAQYTENHVTFILGR